MGALDARTEKEMARFAAQVEAALGPRLVCLALYGSAAGDDWVAGRSDVNLAVVVAEVSLEVLDALAPVVGARPRAIALPLVLDPEYLDGARDTFPMELADLARQHRVLAGRDVLAAIRVEPAAVRRQCEQEARGKLLRLRALYLETAGDPAALERVMVESLKSFLIVLRHMLRLRREGSDAHGYASVLGAGETLVGALPVMRRLLDHRTGTTPLAPRTLRAEFGGYLDEVRRIVAALDRLDA
jgi:hypothetical protein